MKHIAIYVRVSGKQQDTASQKPDLERWAAAQRLLVISLPSSAGASTAWGAPPKV